MKIFSLLSICALALFACNGSILFDSVRGNGEIKSESRSLPTFSKIVLEGSMDIVATAGASAQTFDISGDSNILPLIKTEVRGGVLHVYCDKNYSTKSKLIITTSLTSLEAVTIEGSGDIKGNTINSETMSAEIDGSGDISLNGTAKKLHVSINGSGDANTRELTADDVHIDINGSGNAFVQANSSLHIEINGSGDVEYIGSPTSVNQSINGSGSVRKR